MSSENLVLRQDYPLVDELLNYNSSPVRLTVYWYYEEKLDFGQSRELKVYCLVTCSYVALDSCGFTVVVKTDQEDIVRLVANDREEWLSYL